MAQLTKTSQICQRFFNCFLMLQLFLLLFHCHAHRDPTKFCQTHKTSAKMLPDFIHRVSLHSAPASVCRTAVYNWTLRVKGLVHTGPNEGEGQWLSAQACCCMSTWTPRRSRHREMSGARAVGGTCPTAWLGDVACSVGQCGPKGSTCQPTGHAGAHRAHAAHLPYGAK